MQTHELATLTSKVDELSAQMAYLVERQKKTEELLGEMTPILRSMMDAASSKLGALEQKGYFAFGRELAGVTDKVVTGFSPDDVRTFGDAIVGILQTIRALTQPEVLKVMDEASEVLRHADEAEPLGLFGMVRATRDVDVQRGMAVMMDVMRNVGRAATLVSDQRAAEGASARAATSKREKLAGATGPRKKKVLGVERARAAPRDAQACATPKPAPGEPVMLDGAAFYPDGHLVDPSVWTPELGASVARALGVDLAEAHWAVVDFARRDFLETSASPNIRRLTQGAGVSTKDLYALFPKAPARTVAKIAGIPKPAGCI